MSVMQTERPNVFEQFQKLADEINHAKSLSGRERALIKLASCTTQGEIFGVSLHVNEALEENASKDDILDTIICCFPTGGIARVNQALEAAIGSIIMYEKKKGGK